MNPQESPISTVKPSLPRRFLRWLFSWRSVKLALKAVAIIITLVAILFNVENWRGKRAWETCKRELEAKGEKLDLSAHVSGPIPDDQNFAATPLFSSLFQYSAPSATGNSTEAQWEKPDALLFSQRIDMFKRSKNKQTSGESANFPPRVVVSKGPEPPAFGSSSKATLSDMSAWQAFYRGNTNYPQADPQADAPTTVLAALAVAQPALDELRPISGRPQTVFPVHYEDAANALMPHLSPLKGLIQVLRLRSTALLHAGKPDEALADVRLGWRLIDALRGEPILISHLVRIAMVQILVESIWEGMAQNQWRDADLAELQSMASKLDMLSSYAHAIRGERAFGNTWFEKMRRGENPGPVSDNDTSTLMSWLGIVPTGLLYQNQALINRLHQEGTLQAIDIKKRRVYPKVTDDAEKSLTARRPSPYNILAKMLLPALSKYAGKIARSQTLLDCFTVACALERYHLAKKDYPSELAALVPTYLASVPLDVMDGEPLRYKRSGADLYKLYGIGWDQKDDGGTPLTRAKQNTRSDLEYEKGDWVWIARP